MNGESEPRRLSREAAILAAAKFDELRQSKGSFKVEAEPGEQEGVDVVTTTQGLDEEVIFVGKTRSSNNPFSKPLV